jgi:hypothetical protein
MAGIVLGEHLSVKAAGKHSGYNQQFLRRPKDVSLMPKPGRSRPNSDSPRLRTSLSSSLLKRSASESWLQPSGGLNCQQPPLPSLQVPPPAVFPKC